MQMMMFSVIEKGLSLKSNRSVMGRYDGAFWKAIVLNSGISRWSSGD